MYIIIYRQTLRETTPEAVYTYIYSIYSGASKDAKERGIRKIRDRFETRTINLFFP